jgi:hypothetical protein
VTKDSLGRRREPDRIPLTIIPVNEWDVVIETPTEGMLVPHRGTSVGHRQEETISKCPVAGCSPTNGEGI